MQRTLGVKEHLTADESRNSGLAVCGNQDPANISLQNELRGQKNIPKTGD